MTLALAPGSLSKAALKGSEPFQCSYCIRPSARTISSDGGPATVEVIAADGCAWTAESNDPFITITGGASGTGNGIVTYTVAANTASTPRTGSLTVAGQTATVTQDAACLARPAGLVGWWPGENNAIDIAGSNHGMVQGGTLFSAAKVKRGFRLDGIDDRVEMPDAASHKPALVSVEAWVRFDSLDTPAASIPGLQFVVFKKNSRASFFEGYALFKSRESGVDRLRFTVTSAAGVQAHTFSTTAVMTGEFYHVVGTYDGSTVKLYVNGALESQTPASFPLDYGTRPLFFGSSGEAFDGRMRGVIDEVSIYNRALSNSEIAAIFNADLGGKCRAIDFADVSPDHIFFREIRRLSALGITLGCAANTYCPDLQVTRGQMAAFIIRALGIFNPPQPASQRFQDVPHSHPFYAFIEQMAQRGIMLGCSATNYCPDDPVLRDQMAAFIIRALGTPNPVTPAAQRFIDVPPTNVFYSFIEEMALRRITLGCTANMYCPSDVVTRSQMAAFLVRAFDTDINLPPSVFAGADQSLDANGYISQITNPAGESYQFIYTATGLTTTETDPRKNMHIFTYDSQGRLMRDTDAAGGFKNFARADQSQGHTVTLTTALNRTTTYQTSGIITGGVNFINTFPDGLPRQLTELSSGTSNGLDPDGTMTTSTLGPDPRWRMQSPLTANAVITTPGALAFIQSFARTSTLSNPADLLGLVTQTDTLNINGRNYTSAFTASTRTFVDTSPIGRQVTTVTDAQSRPTQVQFANMNPGNFTYDTRGRIMTSTSGSGGEARAYIYSYNAEGFLASITDPLSQTASFIYDLAGRATQYTLPDSRVIGFGYDASSNITSVTPPGRPAHTLTYSAVDLVSSYTPPAVPGAGATQYAYNLDRQLTTVTRPDALTLNFAYDTAGRLQMLTIPSGVYTYAYSATTGNLTSITAPGGNTLNYSYDGFLLTGATWTGTVTGSVSRAFDNNFRVTSESVNGGNTVNFTYDNDSLLTGAGDLTLARHAQNGLITGTALGSVTDTISYNGFAELMGYNAKFDGSTLYDAHYTYDKLGRITQKVETIGGTPSTYDYTYDAAGRLTQVKLNNVTISTYTYDSNSNRASLTTPGGTVNGAYDDQDRLTQYGATTYAYTANGELQSKTTGGQTTQYAYDVLGNLRNVTLPNGTQIEYVIDGQNRRVSKRVNGALVQGLLYRDQLKPIAELDGSNSVVSRFVYGGRDNVPDYMIKGGVTYRLITDHLGSVRLVVNVATGAVAQRIDYDEFGVVMMDTAPGFQPFGYAGGLYDPLTGLVRFGVRDYDAETGRWSSKDPGLFVGGGTNLYEYVLNNPVNTIDPEGLRGNGISVGPGGVSIGVGGNSVTIGSGGISITTGPTTVNSNGTSRIDPFGLTNTSTAVSIISQIAALKAVVAALEASLQFIKCPEERTRIVEQIGKLNRQVQKLEADLKRIDAQAIVFGDGTPRPQ